MEITISEDIVKRLVEDYFKNSEWLKDWEDRDQQRIVVGRDIEELLDTFFKGMIPISDFKTSMASISKKWNLWGFGGFSGQMFFNQLVNSVEDKTRLSEILKYSLSSPKTIDEAEIKIKNLVDFVEEVRSHSKSIMSAPKAGSVLYFLSFFWQIQDKERFMVFYPSLVDYLLTNGFLDYYEDQPKFYRRFSEIIDSIKSIVEKFLGKAVSMWFVEHIIYLQWYNATEKKVEMEKKTELTETAIQPSLKEVLSKPESELDAKNILHTDAEALLIEIGNLLGYQTYTPDISKKSGILNAFLGDLATMREIPPFTIERLLETVRDIDVIWFKNDFPVFCFEVEHTTGVRDGLLRLYQIRQLPTKFIIVAPSDVLNKFEREVEKDPFFEIKNRYSFRNYDGLVEFSKLSQAYHKSNFLL